LSLSPDKPPVDPGSAFRRFEAVMRKLLRVSKKELDERLAAERQAKQPRRKPAQ